MHVIQVWWHVKGGLCMVLSGGGLKQAWLNMLINLKLQGEGAHISPRHGQHVVSMHTLLKLGPQCNGVLGTPHNECLIICNIPRGRRVLHEVRSMGI